jgi:hypothetical protein
MSPWMRTLLSRSALAITPLWLDPLAWWLAFSSVPAASHAGSFLIQFELAYGLLLLATLGALVVCPVGLFFRRHRANAMSWLLCAGVFTAAFIGGLEWRFNICQTNLLRVTERGQPLVDAITAYRAEHGRPPAKLDELVPKYLDRIPETGIGKWPEFGYWVGEPDRHFGNEWVLVVTPPNLVMGFDSFYYFPRQNYGEYGFGPIGNWGYFRD